MKNAIVIGCGAAGMMSAINLARRGINVTIIEKNEKSGKKLFITGKGRCNLTNACDEETFLKNVVTNPKFLYSSIYNFNSDATMQFFEELGLRIKTERGNRVFPVSDHSSDVIAALVKELKRLNVDILYNTKVTDINYDVNQAESDDGKVYNTIKSVITESAQGKKEITADYYVLATGGVSYPSTGSTGDGFKFADKLEIKSTQLRPALVPLEIKEDICKNLMGVSLKNISVKFETQIKNKKKIIAEDFGEMLFTHFGVSGPVILSSSSKIGKYMNQDIDLYIDLKPAITKEQLDARLLKDFESGSNKQLRNAIGDLLPKSMLLEILNYAQVDEYKKTNEVTKEERSRIVDALKELKLTVTGTRDYNEAIITQGGIAISEINPQNMKSKKYDNLYFAGEVIDLDAFTGGFNLQIAWSTAMNIDIQ